MRSRWHPFAPRRPRVNMPTHLKRSVGPSKSMFGDTSDEILRCATSPAENHWRLNSEIDWKPQCLHRCLHRMCQHDCQRGASTPMRKMSRIITNNAKYLRQMQDFLPPYQTMPLCLRKKNRPFAENQKFNCMRLRFARFHLQWPDARLGITRPAATWNSSWALTKLSENRNRVVSPHATHVLKTMASSNSTRIRTHCGIMRTNLPGFNNNEIEMLIRVQMHQLETTCAHMMAMALHKTHVIYIASLQYTHPGTKHCK